MKNPTYIVSSRTQHSSPQPITGCWRRFLAAGLTLGLVAVLQTVRADSVIYSNDFNNTTNNIANNDLGIGGGFTAFSYNNGVNAYFPSAFETNTWNSLSGGFAVLANSTIGDLYSSLDTISPFSLSAVGTTFELSGVSFSTNTPIPNGGGGASGNVDRLIWGVTTIAPAGAWLSGGPPGTIPTGFWIQFNSDSLVTGTGVGGWSGTSTLFYKDTGTNVYRLCSWPFDTLKWSAAGPNNFTPTLDIKLTLSGTGWALNITGDTATNLPINYSGTYAAGGVLAGTTTPVAISPLLLNGVNPSYWGGFNQTANPGIAMQIDKTTVTQLGTLVVTTPTFAPNNNPSLSGNMAFAGEPALLSSIVTDSLGTPTKQWQLENLASPGTFTNLPSGTATNVSINTAGLGDSLPRGVRLIATDGALSVTSAVVKLTVVVASAPIIVQDISPAAGSFINLYVGQGVTFSASFDGNLPLYYQWQKSLDNGATFNNINNETNATYTIASATPGDAAYYQLQASNSIAPNLAVSSAAGVQVIEGVPQYLWSVGVPFGGKNYDQILTNFPPSYKIAGAMYTANSVLPLGVTNSTGQTIAFAGNGNWATVSGGNGVTTGANTNQTGNANFNVCLDTKYYDNLNHYIQLSGLTVGNQYQVQLFALDNANANKSRTSNWQDPSNSDDASVTYKMGDNVYILGTFVASNTVQTIQQHLPATNGNFNCLVLRSVGWNPPPYFAVEPQNQSRFTQTNASLVGLAAGDATLGAVTYQWMAGPSGGPYVNLTDATKYAGMTASTLTISNLTTADGATVYVLAASNGGGTQNSREAVLLVQSLPPALAPGSYAASALLYNPVALWMLDETNDPSTGLVQGYDYSGNGHYVSYGTAALNGFNSVLGPQPPPYPGFNLGGAAAGTVSGNVNSILTIPPLNDTNLATTVCMWIKPNVGETGNYAHGLIGGRNNTAAGQIWQLGYSGGSGALGYNWNDASATYNYNSGLAPVPGAWNFVAMVIASNNATFYLYYLNAGGQAILQSAVNAVGNTIPVTMAAGTTVIGNDPYSLTSRGFNGSISGVGLFNSALSTAQIQQLFSAGIGLTGAFPPVFVTQPAANTVAFPGYNVQLSATTSGSPPITNQWQFNGTNLVDGYYGPDHETHIVGSTSNVLSINYITTNWAGTYNLVISNVVTYLASSNAVVTVSQPAPPPAENLVGNWFAGAQTLNNQALANDPTDIYSGSQIQVNNANQGSYTWASDLPASNNGGSSINLNNTGILINNTSTNDAGYQNTFDVGISNQFSVAFWAKGWPGGWNAFVSKYGEGPGWQLRNDGNNNVSPCWTIRGNGGTVALGTAVYGNSEDMAATSITYNPDGKWHFYCGTYSLSAGQRQLFVDGNLVAYTTGQGQYNTSPATHLVLGAKDQPPGSPANFNQTNNFTGYFTGEMYDVRIYNTNLNASQQAAIYGTPPEPTVLAFTTQPVATNITFPGFNVQLKAAGNGYAPITNQWQLNGTNLVDGYYGYTHVVGSKSNVLSITYMSTNFAGTYNLVLSNVYTNVASSNAVVYVLQTSPPPAGNLVGNWFTGAQNLTDVSGFDPGVHDGSQIAGQGSYTWTTDLPVNNSGGSSINLNNTGILINNTSTNNAGYENTFDVGISNRFSISCWAKGFPGSWNAWVSKYGETGGAAPGTGGWQLRQYAGNGTSTFTLRGTGSAQAGGDDQQGSINSNDGKWHLYVGTYDVTTKVRSLYVDGVLSVQSTDNGQYTTSPECFLAIGAKDQPPGTVPTTNHTTGYYTGKLYDVRVYNVALTINEQAYIYGTPAATQPTVSSHTIPASGGNPGKFVVTWSSGTLLEATNVAGPWVTNAVQTSPVTNDMTKPADFFKTQQ